MRTSVARLRIIKSPKKQRWHPNKPDPTSVKLSKTSLTLGVGATDKTVTASVEPIGANQEMTVTSEDVKLVTATLVGGAVQVVGIAIGTVKITIASKNKPTVKSELSVTVEAAE